MAYGSDDFIYRYAYGTGLSKISVKVTTPSDVMKLYIQSDRLGSGRYATDAAGTQVAYSFVDVWGLPVDFKKVYVGSTSLKSLTISRTTTMMKSWGFTTQKRGFMILLRCASWRWTRLAMG